MDSNDFIKRLKDVRNNREEHKTKTFQRCFKECLKRIEFVNQNSRNTTCWYEVPSLIPGFPIFDVIECTEYLYNKLTELGFTVKIYKPKIISISWVDILHNNTKNKEKEKEKEKEFDKTPKNLKGLLFKTKRSK